MNNSIKNSLKLLGAATTILCIGGLFLVLNPQQDKIIKTATADIYMGGESSDGEKFRDAMLALGIRPRAYDFNGNVMFFGNSRVHRSTSAKETANIVQEQLVYSGVNKQNYLNYKTILNVEKEQGSITESDENSKNYRDAMLAGELVPTRKDENVYEMSGIVGIQSDDFSEGTKNLSLEEAKEKSLEDYISGYRYVEVRQDKGKTNAEILAVWTGGKFNSKKMRNKPGAQQSPPDPKVPACIGCKRVRRVQALDKDEPYNLNKWVTHSTIDETYNFYLRSMAARGWKESGKQMMFNKLSTVLPELNNIRGRGLTLEKDGEVINITILPKGNGGAEVFSMEKYGDTQPSLEKLPIEPNSVVRDTIGKLFNDK